MLLAAALLAQTMFPLTVEVGNVRNDHGVVRVDICPKERWLNDGCPWHATAPAHAGITIVTLPGVPPGDYGAQAFHDENANDTLDTGFLGIPREGVGFSRDARFVPASPHWADALFTHAGPQTIGLRLRYLRGPASPAEWQARHPSK